MDETSALSGPAADGWQGLVRHATVALTASSGDQRGSRLGTGFFVAPGVVATCAHVLADLGEPLPARIEGHLVALDRQVRLACDPDDYFRDASTGLDIALLRVADDVDVSDVLPMLMSPVMQIGDAMWTFGHPDTAFRAGQSATFTYQGASRRSLGEVFELPRVHGVPVGPGYSGSPVVNLRTGAVCGMLSTSDERGSAHLISVAEILARCPAARRLQATPTAHHGWLSMLTDEQLRPGGWQFPGPRLRAYLDAAQRVAERHPYPGVLPGTAPPPLSAVYVHQEAETSETADAAQPPPGHDMRGKIPAAEIADRGEDVVLVGGPGAGKTSLLREMVRSLNERWRSGQPGSLVPVRVQAADLIGARPVPEAIADSVRADLSPVGLLSSWPAQFFEDPPMPGTGWLVLVDGLDEILDAQQRREVIAMLIGARDSTQPGPYRFLIATRPLPESEQRAFSVRKFIHYELLDLTTAQVRILAEGWFGALDVPEPGLAATRLLTAIDRAGLQELSRAPLMATILCQIHAAHPARALPGGRFAVYQTFTELLADRMYSDTAGGLHQQLRSQVNRYDEQQASVTAQLPRKVLDLLGRLAFEQMSGLGAIALDLLEESTAALRPQEMRQAAWRSLLEETLRRTGLVAQHAGGITFIHQTIGEFLAARHIAADTHLRAQALQDLFGRGRTRVPDRMDSATRFLIAALHGQPDLDTKLHDVAGKGLPGGLCIAGLAADGIPLAAQIKATATTTLFPMAIEYSSAAGHSHGPYSHGGYDRYRAAVALTELGDPRGVDLLAAHAADRPPYGIDDLYRARAATALAELGDPRGVELLAAEAADIRLSGAERQGAIEALVDLGDPRGVELLAELVTNPYSSQSNDRYKMAKTLVELRGPGATDVLTKLVADRTLDSGYRRDLAKTLVELDGQRAAQLLVDLASDRIRANDCRRDGMTSLVDVGDPHRDAASALAELNDPRGVELLAAQATDPTLYGDERCGSARALAELGDPRGMELLAALATDPALGEDRRSAVEELINLGDARGMELLAALATDPTLSGFGRRRAVQTLVRLDDPRAVEVLAARVADPAPLDPDPHLERIYRQEANKSLIAAIESLIALGSADVLAELAADPTLGSYYRRKARKALKRRFSS